MRKEKENKFDTTKSKTFWFAAVLTQQFILAKEPDISVVLAREPDISVLMD